MTQVSGRAKSHGRATGSGSPATRSTGSRPGATAATASGPTPSSGTCRDENLTRSSSPGTTTPSTARPRSCATSWRWRSPRNSRIAAPPIRARPACMGGDACRGHHAARRGQALRRRSPPSTASTSTCPRARASACSAPTARASRRRCACSPRRRSPTRASSHVLGHRLPAESKAARARSAASCPSSTTSTSTLTVEQNLLVFAHLYRVPRAERRDGDRARARASPTSATGRDAKVDELVGRHAPPAADRPRARAPAAAGAARRADRRPGPAGAPGAVGADRRAAQRGHRRS